MAKSTAATVLSAASGKGSGATAASAATTVAGKTAPVAVGAMQSAVQQAEDSAHAGDTNAAEGDGVLPAKVTGAAAAANGSATAAAAVVSGAVASGVSVTPGKLNAKPEDKAITDASALNGLASTPTATGLTLLHPGTVAPHAGGDVAQVFTATTHANGAPVAGNPYMRLDEASAPTVLHASPQRMTVAMSDPSLGNLQVQAQTVNGQVAASLATATAAGHAQLSGHLASLTGFLHDQHVDVARVSVAPPGFSSGTGSGQSAAQGGGGGQAQQGQSYSPPSIGGEVVAPVSGASAQRSAAAGTTHSAVPSAVPSRFSTIDIHA